MSNGDNTEAAREGSLQLGGEGLNAMALLGQAAVALVVVIGVILLLAWLVRRLNLHQGAGNRLLRVVGTTAVGPRERVVIVAIDDTWLVLGVAAGQVTLLERRPAPAETEPARPQVAHGAFAQRLLQAFEHSRGRRGPEDGKRP